MNTSPPLRFQVDDLIVDAGRQVVIRDGEDIELPKLSFDLLMVLIREAPNVVTVDQLMDEVWAGKVVNQDTVLHRVTLLRDALGDDSRSPRYIGVVRGRGYRCLVDVLPGQDSEDEPASGRRIGWLAAMLGAATALLAATAIFINATRNFTPPDNTAAQEKSGQPAAAQIPSNSVAVLAFADLSPEGDQAYFSDGISEELINVLGRIEGLKVAARTSAFKFKDFNADVAEIGETLRVASVLEGSARRDGDRVRITAQLIDTRDGYQLWSDSFDRDLDDIFDVQVEIAHAIVDALKVELVEGESQLAGQRAGTARAYDLYLLGRHEMHKRTPESLAKAIELFEQVIDAEPGYAPAWSGLADSLSLLEEHVFGDYDPEAVKKRALEAARKSVALNPTLADGHASLGLALQMNDEPEQAETSLRKAIELNPGYTMAHMWLGAVLRWDLNRPHEALESFLKAAELDPLHPTVQGNVADGLITIGKPAEAEAHLITAVKFNPGADELYFYLSRAADRQAKLSESHYWISKCVEVAPSKPMNLIEMTFVKLVLGRFQQAEYWQSRVAQISRADGMKAFILLSMGRYEELARLSRERVPSMRGFAELLTGNEQEALAFLDETDWERYPGPKSQLYSQRAYSYRQLGRTAEAIETAKAGLQWLDDHAKAGYGQPWIPYERAMLLALLDRTPEALDALDLAYELGWRDYYRWGFWTPFLDRMIGSEPRYVEFKEKLIAEIGRMRQKVEAVELAESG